VRLKPLLGWAAVVVAMTPLLLLSGVDRSEAGTFEPTLKVTLDNPEPEQSSNTTVDFGVPAGDVNFAAVVAFVPKDPVKAANDPTGMKAVTGTDSELAVLAFAYDSRTKGNAATEIVKYYLQLHYGIEEDYRNFDLLERGNFYQSN